jgi:hypothetical protein
MNMFDDILIPTYVGKICHSIYVTKPSFKENKSNRKRPKMVGREYVYASMN